MFSRKCLRCTNFYHRDCFGDTATSSKYGHCSFVISTTEVPQISMEEILNSQKTYVDNVQKAHTELNVTMHPQDDCNNTADSSDQIGISSTSHIRPTPPRWIERSMNEISFLTTREKNEIHTIIITITRHYYSTKIQSWNECNKNRPQYWKVDQEKLCAKIEQI